MSESPTCFDVLKPFLVNFRVLGQIKPGEVIGFESNGHWYTTPSSSWKSGLRNLWSLITRHPVQAQRILFLERSTQEIKFVILHVSLLMRTSVYLKSLGPNGVMSRSIVATMKPSDVDEIELVLHTFHSVCAHFDDALKGLAVMKSNPPYSTDTLFCSEVDVILKDPILQFMDLIHRRVGLEYHKRVFPFLKEAKEVLYEHKSIVPTEAKESAGMSFVPSTTSLVKSFSSSSMTNLKPIGLKPISSSVVLPPPTK